MSCNISSEDLNNPLLKEVSTVFDNENIATLLQQLSWSHLIELATIPDNTKRNIYTQLSIVEGATGGSYSPRSIQKILKTSASKAGIIKHTSSHTLFHRFAIHLLEAVKDLRYIQSVYGHGSTRTTEIHTHITTKGFDQIVSPLDKLEIKM